MKLKDEENPIFILKAAFKNPQSWVGVVTIIIGIIIACVVSKKPMQQRTQNIVALVGSFISIMGTQTILEEIAKVSAAMDPNQKDNPFNRTGQF